MENEDFRLEEYKQVRGEIVDRERTISQLVIVAIVASFSILSAIGAIYFKIDPDDMKVLDPAYAYPFLGPLGIIIPILFVVISHRRDIHRSGTYLQVFFEGPDSGPKWETRLDEYRKLKKGESLDRVISIFWAIFIISVVAFVFALYRIVGFNLSCQWIGAIIILLVALCFMGIGHSRFSDASVNVRCEYLKVWKTIKKMML